MSTPSTTPLLFLSGAGLPHWIWDEVRDGLPVGTASAVARYPRGSAVRLSDYADAAAAQAPWPAYVVVAHSAGGVVAAELVARHGAQVVGVLGVSAVFPRAGRSFVRTMPLPARLVLGPLMRVAGTRPPAKAIRAGLGSGLPDALADRLVAEFDPESVGLYRDRTSARDWPAARGYLLTGEDQELSPAVQRASADVLAATWTEELPSGHLPMLQEPARVVSAVRRLLDEAGRGAAAGGRPASGRAACP